MMCSPLARLAATGLAAASLLATPALAANLNASSPESIIEVIQNMGYRAIIDVDNQGDPMIRSSAGGSTFEIYFYGCEDNVDCQSIQFSSGYDLNIGTTAEAMNEWNYLKRYSKSYIDEEGDPWLEMDINLDAGGIAVDNFEDSFFLWETLLTQFEDHIDW